MARRIPDSQICSQRPANQNRSSKSNPVHDGFRIHQEALQGSVVRGGGFPMIAKIEGDKPILPFELVNDSLPGHLCCSTTVKEQERLPLSGLADRELHISIGDLVVFSLCSRHAVSLFLLLKEALEQSLQSKVKLLVSIPPGKLWQEHVKPGIMVCRKLLPDRRAVWPWLQAREGLRSRTKQGMPDNKTDQALERIDGLDASDLCLVESFKKMIQ